MGTKFRLLAFISALAIACATQADVYNVDASHTYIGFKVKHMMISNVKGHFGKFSGNFEVDDKGVFKSLNGTVKVASINTGNAKRDKHLQAGDFFAAEKHPELTMEMKRYVAKKDGGEIHVVLTMRGVSRPVVLDVEFGGTTNDPWGNKRAGFTATTTVNRQDYGISYSQKLDTGGVMVGDKVKLELEVEGIAQKKK